MIEGSSREKKYTSQFSRLTPPLLNEEEEERREEKKKMKKRKQEDDDDEEKEEEYVPLPSSRLSKEALLEKFRNFDDVKTTTTTTRDGGGGEEEEEKELFKKMDFNKVPEILKDFEKMKSGGDFDEAGFGRFSSDDDDDDEEEKEKKNIDDRDDIENDDDDISFEEKLLSNAADDRSGKLRMRADIALTDGEYAGKSTSRAKMFAEEEEELMKNNPYYDEDEEEEDFEEDDYPEEEDEDFEKKKKKNKGSMEEEDDFDDDDDDFDDESEEGEEDEDDAKKKKKKNKNKHKKEGDRRRNEYDNYSDDDDDDEGDDDYGGWNIYDEGDEEMRAVLDSAMRKKGKRRKSDKEAAKMFKQFESELPRLNISDDEDEDKDDEENEDDDDDDEDAMEEDDDDEEEDELGGKGREARDNRDEDEDDDDDDFDDDEDDDDDDFDYAGAMEKDDSKRKPSSRKRASEREEEDDDEDEDDDNDEIEDAADPQLEEELKKFELEEQETKRLAEQKAKTEQKSKSVRIQRALWEQMLRMRIKLQRGIENGMKMPGPLANQGLRRLSESTNQSLDSLATAAKDTLLSMLHLQLYLMKQFEKTGEVDTTEIAAKLKNLKQKREDEKKEGGAVDSTTTSTEQFWAVCEAMQDEFAEFRDSSCDRWQRKSQVSSGNAGNLKAFNQNISQQVRSAMLAPEKAIDRSRPALTRTKKIGENVQISRLGDNTNSDDSEDERFDEDEDGVRKNGMESRKDIESYDDFDMYEQLLKEFLESGNVDGDAPRSAAKPAKRRKIVDRRASKGRKLRYHVQEPLVNFVSSIEEEVPQWAEKLFTQLFASKG